MDHKMSLQNDLSYFMFFYIINYIIKLVLFYLFYICDYFQLAQIWLMHQVKNLTNSDFYFIMLNFSKLLKPAISNQFDVSAAVSPPIFITKIDQLNSNQNLNLIFFSKFSLFLLNLFNYFLIYLIDLFQ